MQITVEITTEDDVLVFNVDTTDPNSVAGAILAFSNTIYEATVAESNKYALSE